MNVVIGLICVFGDFIDQGACCFEVRAVTTWECDRAPDKAGDVSSQGGEKMNSGASPETSVATCASAFFFGLSAESIDIPVPLRSLPVEQLPLSARLSRVLERAQVRVLGDLHGRSFDEFARQRNCGVKTLRELGAALRLAQDNRVAVLSQVAASAAASCTFLVPPAARDLKFMELPLSKRVEALVRKMGMEELGDLHGRNAAALLRCSNIGIGTVVEMQRLIERASQGEFKAIPVEPSAAPVALLSLLEAGLSSLASRERELLLDRVGARGTPPATLEQLGRDYRLTKEQAGKIAEETVRKLRKSWGPRIPHLLEIVKESCVSALCPLSPALLERWTKGFDTRLQLTAAAHMRLIAALDREFPCWPVRRAPAVNEKNALDDLIQTLLDGVAAIPVSDAYLAAVIQPDCSNLSFSAFLQKLAHTAGATLHFDQPEAPLLGTRRPNDVRRGARGVHQFSSLAPFDRVTGRLERGIRPAA